MPGSSGSMNAPSCVVIIQPDGTIMRGSLIVLEVVRKINGWNAAMESADAMREGGSASVAMRVDRVTSEDISDILQDLTPKQRAEKADEIYPPDSLDENGVPLPLSAPISKDDVGEIPGREARQQMFGWDE